MVFRRVIPGLQVVLVDRGVVDDDADVPDGEESDDDDGGDVEDGGAAGDCEEEEDAGGKHDTRDDVAEHVGVATKAVGDHLDDTEDDHGGSSEKGETTVAKADTHIRVFWLNVF